MQVLEEYLPQKIANYLGVKAVTSTTAIRVPSKHQPDEGKIRGSWEEFQRSGVIDLRVDLQPQARQANRQTDAFTDHIGDLNFANWQIQYGANKACKSSSRPTRKTIQLGAPAAGGFAGILMQTDTTFALSEIQEAVKQSFAHQCYVQLTKTSEASTSFEGNATHTKDTHCTGDWTRLCDLDVRTGYGTPAS